MILSWASLFGYLQARTTAKVERVVFLIDAKALELRMSLNDGDARPAPLKYEEIAPLIEGFAPSLGVPEGADILKGSVDIDYVNNAATIAAYYLNDGRKQRTERQYKF